MKIIDIPLTALRFQYHIARIPLSLVEQQLVARLDPEASVRLLYERSLGMLDVAVGAALSAPRIKQRGDALIERSDAGRRAAHLDAAATQNIKQAGAELRETREEAKQSKHEAHEQKERDVKRAREDAIDRKRAAVDKAEKRIGAGKKQADELAARRKNAVDDVKLSEQARSRTAERSATAAANAEMKDAQQKHSAAATERAQADRIEAFAEDEKHTRQRDPSNSSRS